MSHILCLLYLLSWIVLRSEMNSFLLISRPTPLGVFKEHVLQGQITQLAKNEKESLENSFDGTFLYLRDEVSYLYK